MSAVGAPGHIDAASVLVRSSAWKGEATFL